MEKSNFDSNNMQFDDPAADENKNTTNLYDYEEIKV